MSATHDTPIPGKSTRPGGPVDAHAVAGLLAGTPRRIHLIGLAGTGISALAMILRELGREEIGRAHV